VPLNVPQQLFLDQARSDYEIYGYLSRRDTCHRLHYLQMCTEKLAKVYFWRGGVFPGYGHHKFEPFLRALDTNRPDFYLMFGYKELRRFNLQKPSIFNLASRLQNLAPSGGNLGPNPEYPWPPNRPTQGPLTHAFVEWSDWNESTAGRRLRFFVSDLLNNYMNYFP
jgi:hypothetical protein